MIAHNAALLCATPRYASPGNATHRKDSFMAGSIDMESLVSEAHETALAKGWWSPYGAPPGSSKVPDVPPDALAAKIMLIVTECAEAVECVRDGDVYARRDPETSKPEGLPFELADVVIRVADLCGALGIDLDAVVREKLDYNRTRAHRHGGRAL